MARNPPSANMNASARQLIEKGSVIIKRDNGVVEARIAGGEVIIEWRTLTGLAFGNSVMPVYFSDERSDSIGRCLAVGLLNIAEATGPS